MRTDSKIDIVAVLPDGAEYFAKIRSGDNTNEVASDAIRKSQHRSKYGEAPTMVCVRLYKLEIEGGAIKRTPIRTASIQAPMERMTQEYYLKAMASALEDIPIEFHRFVRDQAYDRGHSAGLEEVLSYAISLASDIEEPIKRFRERITRAKQ